MGEGGGPRMTTIPTPTMAWLAEQLGPGVEVTEVTPLPPASHTNHRVRGRTVGGAELDVLLRRFTADGRLHADPWYEPAAEAHALAALETLGAPAVPRLIAGDVDAEVCDVPALLLTWVPGDAPTMPPADVVPFVHELAAPLPAIHALTPLPSMRTYEPYFTSDGVALEDLRPPAWSRRPELWERAFAAVAAPAPDGPRAFIHRDYHHGNTVWSGGRLAGVIDWTTGCGGPPGIDLAQARINLAWDIDLAASDRFLEAWRAAGGEPEAFHPYWDLLDAVDWLGDGTEDPSHTPAALERYEAFTARALADLG
jgi:aminoglycoside phosphotransferase (APT) family kinase protein